MGALERKRQKKIKDYVIERDGSQCCYCERKLNSETITMEHIVPSSKRGTYNTTNLTVACAVCNKLRGNKPFFSFCKGFKFSKEKIKKYENLYLNNLKIKILNIAKEECLVQDKMVPLDILREACLILRIKSINFMDYSFGIDIDQPTERKKIKFSFEKLIKDIEANTR